uniref:Uncharacterized protein n=1 Tax=CrAss-like virus sp. ctt4r3 TaxID=2823619 RepID=A0A8S5L7R9_9CAUD|nr:MAG TPA: hypothetical protein [CrAss-like virus sp. ctt4r3]DAO22220.1 MAG TPA: hypothetical protein [Bacteriophage sp.]
MWLRLLGFAQRLRSPVGEEVARPLVASKLIQLKL